MQLAKYDKTPPIGERLIVIKNDITHEIMYPYSLEGAGDISVRNKAEKRAFTHGGTLCGDGYIDSKKLKIGILIAAPTQAEHDYEINNLLGLFYAQNYKLINGKDNSYYNVASLESVKSKFIKGYKNRWSDVDINLLLTDPFRYSISTEQKTFDVNGENTLEMYNVGSVDTPLTITVTPQENENIGEVTIEHLETGNKFSISDSLLIHPATSTISTSFGTVRRGVANSINTFNGQFLTAIAGNNKYKYTGGKGKIALNLTARWLM